MPGPLSMPSTRIRPGPALSEHGPRASDGPSGVRRQRWWNGAVSWNRIGGQFVSCCSTRGRRGVASAKAVRSVASSRARSAGRFSGGLRMNIKQLEHILRACGSLAGCREIIVIGSQALLASHPDAPEELLRSMEVDCYPLDDPAKADLIDGSIGELSPFHETFGYYAHGIGPETATLPMGWKARVVRLESENTGGTIGLCL